MQRMRPQVRKYSTIHDAAPNGNRLGEGIRHTLNSQKQHLKKENPLTLPSPRRIHNDSPIHKSQHPNHVKTLSQNIPIRPSHDIQNLQIQPPHTKTPLIHMPIRTLKIRASRLLIERDIPTTAALVGNKRQPVRISYGTNEIRVLDYRGKSVVGGECGAFE